MAVTILKIGGVDLSMITEQEGVQIRTSPVYDDEFTSVVGKKQRKVLGESVDISASFNHVPEDIAAQIVSACRNDSVTVEYKDPIVTSAVFDRPEYVSVPDFAASEDERYWNISVSMSCPLKGDGL
ncbi:MAG: hypothetical protein MSJ26_07785 [Oscillospiraceae bacterium]|nr:hypothetical protein [Oscillospiraceae bacterium]